MRTLLVRVAVTVVATLLLSEGLLRVYHHVHPMVVFEPPSPNRFRPPPFAIDFGFRLNSRGFKDREFTPKVAGIRRVVALGDSFAYGVVPYEFNYLTLVEDMMNARGGQLEILNIGIPAIGPRDYLTLFVKEGLELAPDFVLLSFFIGNDFTDNFAHRRRRLFSYSYLATLVRHVTRLRGVPATGFRGHGPGAYDDTSPSFSDEQFLEIETYRSRIYRPDYARFNAMVAQAVAPLQELKRICDRHGIGLLVVAIPDEVQVEPALQQRVLARMGRRAGDLDFSRPNAILARRLADSNIELLDLLEPFRIRGRTVRLYKPSDTHWNIAGNRLAADLIAAHLASSGALR